MKDFDGLFTEGELKRLEAIKARKRVAVDLDISSKYLSKYLKGDPVGKRVQAKMENRFGKPISIIQDIFKNEGIVSLERIKKDTSIQFSWE